jgi:hypothetical protein
MIGISIKLLCIKEGITEISLLCKPLTSHCPICKLLPRKWKTMKFITKFYGSMRRILCRPENKPFGTEGNCHFDLLASISISISIYISNIKLLYNSYTME